MTTASQASHSPHRPVVAITNTAEGAAQFFTADDLQRLGSQAEIRFVGEGEALAQDGDSTDLSDVTYFLGAWGMPPINESMLRRAPNLRAVCYAAGTIKPFVTKEAYDRGIIFTTAMSKNAEPVAEWCQALITLINKGFFGTSQIIREQGFPGFAAIEAEPADPLSSHPGNFGTTVGLIGFGAIARSLAQRLQQTMQLRVLAYDPTPHRQRATLTMFSLLIIYTISHDNRILFRCTRQISMPALG